MNGYHKLQGENYLIEQYTPLTANICLRKPYEEGFVKEDLHREIKGVLRPILANSDVFEKEYLIYIYNPEKIVETSEKHNDTKIEIYFKFKNELKFKQKVSIINEIIPKITSLL